MPSSSQQTIINNLVEEPEHSAKNDKVEIGNYRDSSVYVGMLGTVFASIDVILYLKKKNELSED